MLPLARPTLEASRFAPQKVARSQAAFVQLRLWQKHVLKEGLFHQLSQRSEGRWFRRGESVNRYPDATRPLVSMLRDMRSISLSEWV